MGFLSFHFKNQTQNELCGGGEENQGPGGRVGLGKRTRGGGEKRSSTGEEIAGGEEGAGTAEGGRRRRRRGFDLQQMG